MPRQAAKPDRAEDTRTAYQRTRPNIRIRTTERATLSAKESTRITGFGLNYTYDMLEKRLMPGIKIGNRWYVPRAALLAWLDEMARTGLKIPSSAA